MAVYVYLNSKLDYHELVDMLRSLGFADDYQEVPVLCLYDAMLPTDEKQYDGVEALVNLVFDNADIRILNGHGTWHAMGGITGVTPGGDCIEPELHRTITVRSSATAGRFAEVPLTKYKKPAVPGLKNVHIGPFEPPNRNSTNLRLANVLDNIRLTSYFSSII